MRRLIHNLNNDDTLIGTIWWWFKVVLVCIPLGLALKACDIIEKWEPVKAKEDANGK